MRGVDSPIPQVYAKSARLFAGFSYTLYATHLPLLFLFRARFIGKNVWDPDWLHLFYALGIAAVTMAIAWAIAQATEARTAAVRRKVMAWLPQSFRAATIHA